MLMKMSANANIIFFTIAITIGVSMAQLFYPESDTNENRKPVGHNRPTVVSPKCSVGELLYPGDNEGDWVCDCAPTYVYHPQTSRCWAAYSRGPCERNEVLSLQKSKPVPVCERSTCEEGKIKFQNVCSKLESYEACRQPSKGATTNRLYVNPTTLQLYCTFRTPTRVDGNQDDNAEGYYENGKECFLGGKRSQNELCPKIAT